MVKILFFALLLVVAAKVPQVSGAGGDILWQVSDPQPGKHEAKTVVTDPQGNVVVTGFRNLAGGSDDDYFTVKFSSDGSGAAWRATFDRNGGSDQATGVTIDSNGDVIVSGFVANGINTDIHTIKYSGTTGAVIWQHSFDGFVNGNDVATSVAVDSLNNVYVAGYSQNNDGFNDYIVLKYAPSGPNPDGTPAWVRMNEGQAGGNDQLLSMSTAVTAGTDGLAVTGQAWNGTSFDILTVKYDFSGTKLWEKRHSTGPSYACIGKQVRMDASGNVIVTGSVENGIDLDIYTAKYHGGTGNLIWERTFNGAYDDEPRGLVVDTNGDVFITGYTWTLAASNDFYTAGYDAATGALLWEMLFDSGAGEADLAVATGISVDPGSDVFVTGYSVLAGNYDIQTIKYKRDNGMQLWQRSYDGPAHLNERPVGIGFTPAGEVLIGGWTDSGANGQDYLVIKYDAGTLNAPTLLGAETLPDTSIRIDWQDNSTNETGFAIERKLGEFGTFAQIAIVGADTSSYTDTTGLEPENLYFYRVRAFSDTSGFSHYSNEAHALTFYVAITSPAWVYSYNNPDNMEDFATAIGVGPDNHPVVTGYSLRTVGGFDYYTLKLNRGDKAELWNDLYDDPDSEIDIAKCLTVDRNSNAFVSGYSSLYYDPAGMNINSIFTLKYPAAGPPATWSAQYNGPGAIDDRATAIASTSDAANNVVVTGYGKNVAGNEDIYLVKYAADGSLAWAATPFDGPGHGDDIPSSVAIGPDGSVVVTGYSEKSDGGNVYSFFVAKYHGTTGAMIWSDIHSVTPSGSNRGSGVAVDPSGDIYMTGTAVNAAGNNDIHTIKYSGSSGSAVRIWERAVDGGGHGDDEGVRVVVDPVDGAIVVAGSTLTSLGDHDMTLIRYDRDGTPLWPGDGVVTVQRHDTDEHCVDLAVDPSGYLYLAGNSDTGGGADVIAYVLNHEGVLLGATEYNGAANGFDEASSIAVNAAGESFIAGYTTNGSGNADYLVLKQVNPFILVPAPFTTANLADYSRLNLSWSDNTPGTSFRIERTLGPVTDSSVWTQIAAVLPGTVALQDSGLNQGTSYCYRITALDGSLESRKLTSCATTTLAPPVFNQLAVVSQTSIDLTWLNVPGNTGYRVERMPAGGSWSPVGPDLPAGTTTYSDTGLTPGAVYSYRLITLSSAGESAPSSVQVAPVLNALSGVTATKIDLTWPAVAGASGYVVERSNDNLVWAQTATPAAGAVSFSDATVGSGLTYYYRLRVVSGGVTSGPSLVRSALTLLKTPTLSSATPVSTTQIALAWTDPNTNEAGQTVEYAACSPSYDNPTTCTSYLTYDWAWSAWTPVPMGPDLTGTTLDSLLSGRTYRFRVTANLSGASSVPSTMLTATPHLTGPTDLQATAATSSSVTLTWSDILGETNYKVEKDGVPLVGVTLNRNTTSYTVTGLNMNVQYCFRVQPYNAGSSAFSNQACVTIYGPPTLNPPVVDSQNQITLTWTDVPGETAYEVWRALPVSQSNPTTWNAYVNLTTPTPLPADTVSFVNPSLSAGYTYKYKLRFKLPDENFSAFSNEVQATTIPPTPNLTSTPLSTSQIRLNWGDGYGETSYSVQHKPRETGSCATEDWGAATQVPVAQNAITTTISSLSEGATYCFRIRAANSAGSSPWGTALTQTTLLSAPVLNPLSGITQSKIDLSWNNITGNSGYKIERSLNGTSWSQFALPGADVVTWSDTTVAANTLYFYRVSTKNSAGSFSAAGNVQSATTLPVTPPVISSLSGVTRTQITITWGGVPENNGYRLERSLDNVSWSTIANPAAGATFYTNTGLTAGSLYYYRVSTRNLSGSYSVPSNVMSATTTPNSPTATVAVVSESQLDLSWQVVYGATNYRIQRSVGPSGPWTEVADSAVPYTTLYCGLHTTPTIGCPTLVPAYTSRADAGLAQNTEYCYKMTAWNATGGDSTESPVVCGKTPAVNSPVITSVQAQNSLKITVTWSYNPLSCSPVPCETPDGFQVWRQLPSSDWALIDSLPNTGTYVDATAIEPEKRYSYKVRAYRGSDLSPFSTASGVTTPAFAPGDSTCP